MPDDWGDEFGGDWDLDGSEMFLDDELELDEELDAEDEDAADDTGWGTDVFDDLDDEDMLDEQELGGIDVAFVGGGAPADGGDAGAAGGVATTQGGGERMSWSAWDVGVAFGLGGWMLDQHAEQIGREVRAALAASPNAAATRPGPLGAPHPPPASGIDHGAASDWLQVGDPLRLPGLHARLTAAQVQGKDLLLQAEGTGPGGGRLVLVVSVVPGSAGPSLWVVAEQHPGGFAASRLVPVFQADASGGFAVFATDLVPQAVDAVAWACRREGIESASLTVTR
jgi:hypothetical protein